MIPLRGEEEAFIVQLSLVLGEGCFGDANFPALFSLHMSVGRSSMALEKASSPEMQIIGGGVIQSTEMVGLRDMRGGVTEFATNPASKDEEPFLNVHSRKALVK